MRKKLICCFIALVLAPVVILYLASFKIFDTSKREYLQTLSTKNIETMGKTLNDYFLHPIDLSMYPFMEPRLLEFLKTPQTDRNYFQIYQNAYSILSTTPYANAGILGVSLCSPSNQKIKIGFEQSSLSTQDMINANRANGTQVWGKTTAPDGSILLTISRLIRDTSDSSRHLGYVKVVVSTDEIRNLLRSSNDIPGVSYYVIDTDGQEVANSDNAQPYSKLKDYFEHNLAGGNEKTTAVTINGGLFYVSAAQIQKTPYILYSITSAASALNIQSALLKGVSFTAIMLILFGVIFSVVLSKWLVRPLQTLSSMTETVAAGDFSRRISTRGNDEIASLARQFNKMTMELKNLYNKVYASKLKQQQAEYSALLAKINPHFLHNTLDAIYWMAQSDKNERVAKMVSALSGMMRYTISSDDHGGMTLLGQETDCLKSYLYIQHVRYGDNIQFLLTMEPGLENCLVLRFILQPLVENAIVHGVAPVGNGIVDVLIYRDAEQLIYEIRNTGQLADTEKLQKALCATPNGTKGFALRNISDRLHLKFGESGKIEAQSDGVQTIFKVTQPYQPSDTKPETNES